MRIFRQAGRRSEDEGTLAEVAAPSTVMVMDAAGNRWRIRDARYGPGLEVCLAEAEDGTQAMHLEPDASNAVTLRPRGTQ